tara:strand:+ start:561 stop:737 length:177 start_codon:yes stop_codon:yes gene_type:complete
MHNKEQCILNEDLVDAKDKYNALLAQSKKEKKRIGTLVQQLATQTKTTTKSIIHALND